MPSTLSNWIERRVKSFVKDQRRKKNAVRVLAEGDSWFTYGGLMWFRKSLITRLNDYQTLNIVSLAQPGAELPNMVSLDNRQWALSTNPNWLKNQTYDLVLLSGGGNDVVGEELKNYLFHKSPSRSGIQLVKKSVFEDTLARMKRNFKELRRTVDALLPGRPILVHGYDYSFPSGDAFELFGGLVTIGPWIKNRMIEKGITDLAEQQIIVNHLVDRFNDMLAGLQSKIDDFHYLDLRGTLVRQDWADELHPTAAGRDKLARKFRTKIVSLV